MNLQEGAGPGLSGIVLLPGSCGVDRSGGLVPRASWCAAALGIRVHCATSSKEGVEVRASAPCQRDGVKGGDGGASDDVKSCGVVRVGQHESGYRDCGRGGPPHRLMLHSALLRLPSTESPKLPCSCRFPNIGARLRVDLDRGRGVPDPELEMSMSQQTTHLRVGLAHPA